MTKYPEKKGIANTIYAFRCCNEHQEDVEFSECEELAGVILDELNPPINPLEVRFKGKRVDNGEWVEGYFYKLYEDYVILTEGSYQKFVKVIPESVELILPKEGE